MSLSKKEIDGLIRLISLTKDEEINCEQCLSSVAEFAEQELKGKSVPEALKAVEHHLSVCAECHEEYIFLQSALRKMDG
ncbi:MAG: hypothetical protein V3R25_09750 [Nitrosomonadaceae bacterium]|jgi:uncharacterized protein with PIN domain